MLKRKGETSGSGQGASVASGRQTGDLLGPPPAGGRSGQVQQLSQQAETKIGTRFTMKQQLISFGDDFWIANERGEHALRVNGKMLRLSDTLLLEDAHGRELYRINARLVDVRETMDIARPNGGAAAVVHDAWFSPMRDRWTINIPGGADLLAHGNVLQHEYEIRQDGRVPVAVISKKWLRLRDTYQVEVQDSFDAPLVLAITIVIDIMSHNHAADTTAGGISKGGLDAL